MSATTVPSPPTITLTRLLELARRNGSPAVSIQVPIDRSHPDDRVEHDTLDRLLDAARRRLRAQRVDADALLAPVLEAFERRVISEHGSGVAFFVGGGTSAEIAVGQRLDPLLVIGERFEIAPLLPSVDRSIGGHLLSLDVDHVRLHHIGGAALHECHVSDLPSSVDEALWFERSERHRSSHSENVSGRGGVIRRTHGTGAQHEDRKARLERFFHIVDHAVLHHIGDDRSHPLVLAGPGPVVARYRALTRHPWTTPLEVGSTARLPLDELRRQVADAVAGDESVDDVLERFGARLGTGLAGADLAEIVEAAAQGSVATLLVGSTEPWWARWPDSVERLDVPVGGAPIVDLPRDAVDLVNLAVSDALRTRATVHLVPPERVPGGPLGAIYRY